MKHDWEYMKLGETLIFDKKFNGLAHGQQPKVAKFSHVSAEELKGLAVEGGTVRLISTGNFCGFTTIEKAGKALNEGEIVTIPTGGTANIKYFRGLFVDSGNILGVAKDKSIWLRYIYYAMLAKTETINSLFRGASIKHPYMPDIYKIPIPVPPVEKQKEICSLLDKLSLVIEKKKQQVKQLDTLAQSIFYDMFGNPNTNEKGWEIRIMNDICLHIVDCPHSTPKKSDRITQYPCIRTSELKDGNILWDSMQYLEENEYNIRIARLKPIAGDIVFGREGTLGDAVILPEGYCFSLGQRTMLLRVDGNHISNVFLQRVILSEWVKKQIRIVNVSSTVPHINIKDFKQFIVPVPPLSIQQSFAQKVESIERQKELINQSIREAQTLFDSRMEYYFGE